MTDQAPSDPPPEEVADLPSSTDALSDGQPDPESEFGDELGDFSLDDLGAVYAKAAAEHDPEAFASRANIDEPVTGEPNTLGSPPAETTDADALADADSLVTPEAIIEGALFVGHPENQPLTEERIAKLIRDMTPEEVVLAIEKLNDSYRKHGQALRIKRDDFGYKMSVAPEVEHMRQSFLGKVREARLSQAAIEVLSLVAYQPGISAQKVQDQRGHESNSLLNQLVRRQLLQIERVKPEEGGRAIAHYYPTERFLYLFGIESLEDLPQVEEGLREDSMQ